MAYIEKEPLCAWLENMGVSDFIIRWIESKTHFPAVDAVEVKRGYIIEHQGTEDDYYCECSVCGTHEVSLGDKYCSECGAKLEHKHIKIKI